MKKYLITGCAGFIGSNFVYYMLKKYDDILLVNLDKLTYAGNLENLKGVEGDERHVFVQGDICDRELVTKLFEQYDFDYVINFAAESHVDRSITNPEIFVETNEMCIRDSTGKMSQSHRCKIPASCLRKPRHQLPRCVPFCSLARASCRKLNRFGDQLPAVDEISRFQDIPCRLALIDGARKIRVVKEIVSWHVIWASITPAVPSKSAESSLRGVLR